MSRRILLLTAIACTILPGAGSAGNDDFREDFDALKASKPRVTLPVGLQLWDGQVIASQPDERVALYYRIDVLKPEKLILPGIDRLIMLSYGDGKPIALGATNHEGVLLLKNGNSFKMIPLPPSFGDFSIPRLIPSTVGIAVIDSLHFRRYQNDRWTVIDFPRSQGVSSEFSPYVPAKDYIVGSHLFGTIGNQFGDFDLDKPKLGWREAAGSGAVLTDTSVGLPTTPPGPRVSGMTLDPKGNLWVCKNNQNPNHWWRGLYRYDGKSWETKIQGPLDGAKLNDSPAEMAFVDVFAAADGQVYILGQCGIFTYQDDMLKPAVKFNFRRYKELETQDDDGKVQKSMVAPYPSCLVVDAAGNVFVSAYWFGILCFMHDGATYHLKQVILPEAEK